MCLELLQNISDSRCLWQLLKVSNNSIRYFLFRILSIKKQPCTKIVALRCMLLLYVVAVELKTLIQNTHTQFYGKMFFEIWIFKTVLGFKYSLLHAVYAINITSLSLFRLQNKLKWYLKSRRTLRRKSSNLVNRLWELYSELEKQKLGS